MAQLPPRKRVRDVEMLRALAHPLRTALLNYLLSVGARTASECAAEVGSSPSNCSWHLRHLAGLGLVERVDGGDGRERPWRATEAGLDFGSADENPAVRSTQLALLAAQLTDEHRVVQRWVEGAEQAPQQWRAAAGYNRYGLRVTPEELAELLGAVDALLRPYVSTIRTGAPPDAAVVHVGLRAFPMLDADGDVTP